MIETREMTLSDIEECLALSRAAGWNQLDHEWRLFLTLDPQSCRVATLEGRIVGTVATIRYEDRLGWIGMMLVDERQRRLGVGSRLMEEALDLLANQKTIGLDATPVGREVYLKLGFVDDSHLIRMSATKIEPRSPEVEIRPMTLHELPAVAAIDADLVGVDRRPLIDWMFRRGPKYAWVAIFEGRIHGYCFGRSGHSFEHIGPVVANNHDTAAALVSTSCSGALGRAFVLDIPESKVEWQRAMNAIGFSELRPLFRMYRGGNRLTGIHERVYAILGPEFG